jgi:hypothetical protein
MRMAPCRASIPLHDAGRYLLCGLPVATDLNLRTAAPFLRVESINRGFEAEGLYRHDFTLSANP